MSEPLLMPRYPGLREMGCKTGVQGLAVEERQAAAVQIFAGRVNTAGLGVEGAPTPVAARVCGTWKPRRGPAALWGAAGKPEVTKA